MRFKTIRSCHTGIWVNLFIFIVQIFLLTAPSLSQADDRVNSAALPILKALQIIPSDGLTIKFYFEHNEAPFDQPAIDRVARIFLSGVAFDAKDLWVNLSPYEEDRVMSPLLAVTELGEVMAQQDYLLKKRAALLTHPDTQAGQKFWNQLSKSANQSSDAAEALAKVWIVPESADVYHLGDAAVLGDMHLKVMVEKDYLALSHRGSVTSNSNQDNVSVTRDIICPLLEKEVNESNDFAPLRQIFQALILAHWFKTYHADQMAALDYVQSAKIQGIDLIDYQEIEGIYEHYYQMYKNGAYSLIREDNIEEESVPRKYFAGGLTFDPSKIRFIDSSWDWVKQKLGKVRLDVATLAFAAIMASPFSVSAAQDIAPPLNSTSVMELREQFKGSTRAVMGYMTDFQQRGRTIKSPLPNQVKMALAPSDAGKLDVKLVNEIKTQSRGFAKPRLGGGTYTTILDRGAVWVQHQDGTQTAINTATIKTFVPQSGDMMILQNRTPTKAPAMAVGGAPPPETAQNILKGEIKAQPVADSLAMMPPVIVQGQTGEDNAWDKYLGASKKKVSLPPPSSTKDQGYSVSVTSEAGYMMGTSGGPIGEADIQVGKKDARVGEFSLYGGLRLTVMPKYTLMQSGDEMMPPGLEKKIEKSISPYIGFHKPGKEFDTFFELQDFKNAHFGVESRPVYDQGWNYNYGLSGLIYDSVKGYKLGMMGDGYLSFKLAKIFPSDSELFQRTYLSSTLKVLMSSEGTRIGGGVKLTYNDRWQLFAEVSPFKDLPMTQEAMGHHYDLYKTRMGVAYRMSQNLELFGQWVEPIGHMNEKNRNFMLGFRWSFDKPSVTHNSRNRPVDYLQDSIQRNSVPAGNPPPELPLPVVPKVGSPASSAIIAPLSSGGDFDDKRRGFLKTLTAGALIVGANPGALAAGNNFFEEVYKTDPNSFPVCGEPLVILAQGDPLTSAHIIYLSFMYWYFTDKSNNRATYDDPQKQYFLNMSVWQWDEFLKERRVTKRHEDFARIIQKKMSAELQAAGIMPLVNQKNDGFQIDGKLFSSKFREWLDRWVIKLVYLSKENSVELFPELGTGEIPPIEKEKRNQIKIFLNKFVTGDDVVAAMKLKGQETGSDILNFLKSRFPSFFSANPQWIIMAAQIKLNAKGYTVPQDGKLNPETLKAIRKEVETNPEKASSVLTPGGIDFGNLPQVTAWLDLTNGNNGAKAKDFRQDVVGMTFKVLDVQTTSTFDFVKN